MEEVSPVDIGQTRCIVRKQSAFTLIELLIVMIIILILAGILYPVFISARNKALQVKCASQMRQIGMAVSLYANDYDDFLPIGAYSTAQLPAGMTFPAGVNTSAAGQPLPVSRVDWQDALIYGGYVKSYTSFVCPSSPSTDYRYSYGVNRHVMWWAGSLRSSLISYPANTVMVTEKGGMDWVAWQPSERANNPYYIPLQVRHNGQINVLFGDGHVSHVGYGQLIEGGSVLWNP